MTAKINKNNSTDYNYNSSLNFLETRKQAVYVIIGAKLTDPKRKRFIAAPMNLLAPCRNLDRHNRATRNMFNPYSLTTGADISDRLKDDSDFEKLEKTGKIKKVGVIESISDFGMTFKFDNPGIENHESLRQYVDDLIFDNADCWYDAIMEERERLSKMQESYRAEVRKKRGY